MRFSVGVLLLLCTLRPSSARSRLNIGLIWNNHNQVASMLRGPCVKAGKAEGELWRCMMERAFNMSGTNYVGEPVLQRLVSNLLNDCCLLPRNGSVVDAGANQGQESVLYSRATPPRIVHAVEPLPENIAKLEKLAVQHPNVVPHRGGLSDADGEGAVSEAAVRGGQLVNGRLRDHENSSSQEGPKVAFQVFTIDSLYSQQWRGESPAFFHLDLEGGELAALRGARRTIAVHHPWFTVESYPHLKREAHEALMAEVRSRGYTPFEVDEICGSPRDCRNFLCVPDDSVAAFTRSIIFEELTTRLRRIDAL